MFQGFPNTEGFIGLEDTINESVSGSRIIYIQIRVTRWPINFADLYMIRLYIL